VKIFTLYERHVYLSSLATGSLGPLLGPFPPHYGSFLRKNASKAHAIMFRLKSALFCVGSSRI